MHFQPVEHPEEDAYLIHGGGDHPPVRNDIHDDVFGGGEFDDAESSHPSDMGRIEREHSTAGYREGLEAGKQTTLQKGFDQGYSIGAAIGLEAGIVLGILQGITEALKGQGEDFEKMGELLERARGELALDKIFSSEYWKPSGMPSYEVDDAQLQSRDGALAHPLIRKWAGVLDEQCKLWAIDRSVLNHINPNPPAPLADDRHDHAGEATARDPLEW